jgi:CrcB protein
MWTALVLALAGALGTLARYGVNSYFHSADGAAFSWATFVVNVLGSLVLGVIVSARPASPLAHWLRLAGGIGFLGAFTTFSTLSLETYRLLDGRAYGPALSLAGGTFCAGVLAVYVGVRLGTSFAGP